MKSDKAVLVIDMPEEYRTEDVLVDYCLHTKGEYKVIRKSGNHPLKPLPKHIGFEETETETKEVPSGFYDETIDGWNWCLDEILGDYITQEEADLCGVQLWHDDQEGTE